MAVNLQRVILQRRVSALLTEDGGTYPMLSFTPLLFSAHQLSVLILLLLSWFFSHTVLRVSQKGRLADDCCLFFFRPHLKRRSQVGQYKLLAFGSLVSQHPLWLCPFIVLPFADSVGVRLALCWLTQESDQHPGSWTDGTGSQVMEDSQGVMSGACC